MKQLYFPVLSFFLMLIPLSFAIPDAPAFVWLTSVENPPFDNDGILTVNWDSVINEDIARYNIIVSDAASGQILFFGTNTTADTFLFSGYTYGNYTFQVSAINSLGEEGSGTLSEWVYIDTIDPTITFMAPTPENNAYTKNNWTTISVSVTDSFLDSVIINWNGADTLFKDQSGVIRSYPPEMLVPGKYAYYVQANDSAGNSVKSEVRYINYDTTKPLVSISSPQNGAVYNTSSIPLEYAANDTSPITCWYEYDFANTTLNNCANVDFNPTYSNKANLTLWVSDAAGNIEFAFVSFTANAPTPPEIVSTIPVNGKVLEAPSISGKFNDILSITTNKQATCKYSTAPNTSFDSMAYSFTDTSENIQNATVSLADKAVYSFYIRCKSSDNIVSANDYVLQFSTAAPDGLIILDPSGTLLKNNVIKIETIKDKPTIVNVPLKTSASYDVYGVTATVSEGAADFMRVEAPRMIPTSELSYLRIDAFPDVFGVSKANVTLNLGTYSSTFLVDIITFDDFYPEFTAIDLTVQNISSQLQNLSLSGVDVAEHTAEMERMKSDIAEIYSLYNSESPAEARKKFLQLNDSVNILKENILMSERAADESAASIARKNNSTENGSDSNAGIGGISLSTIVVVIFVVIIVIIIAASYVPDNGETTPTTAPVTPDSPGV